MSTPSDRPSKPQSSERPSAPPSERRRHARHAALFPARVLRDDGDTAALVRDVSEQGLLLYTQERLAAGSHVKLELFFSADLSAGRTVAASVVRSAARDPHSAGIWAYSAALRFDEPLADVDGAARALAARQSALGIIK